MPDRIRHPADSETLMTEVVFPNDTNPIGIVQGGRIIQLMDIACAICAQTHSGRIAVTASIDKVSFREPAKLGDILTIKAKVTRTFRTSMEIFAQVWAKRIPALTPILTNQAYFTFVALDEKACPAEVPPLVPQTEEEMRQYESASTRRSQRIISN